MKNLNNITNKSIFKKKSLTLIINNHNTMIIDNTHNKEIIEMTLRINRTDTIRIMSMKETTEDQMTSKII